MKNLTFAIFIAMACTGILHAQQQATNSHYVPFHTYLKNNNTSKSLGANLEDNEIAYRHDAWASGAWVFNDSGKYEYNSQGSETNGTAFSYSPVNDSWSNDTLNSYTYDQSGNQLTHLSQSWSTAGNSWINTANYTATYNTQGKPLTETYQIWASDGGWVNTYNFIYSYNNRNSLSEKTEQAWSSAANAWINTQKTTQAYSPKGQLASAIVQSWNGTANNWANFYSLYYSYDGQNNQTDRIEQTWQSSQWINSYKDSSVLDTNNNVVARISQSWDTVLLSWVNTYQSKYAFDNNHDVIQFAAYNWSTGTAAWAPVFLNAYLYNGAGKLLNETDSTWNEALLTYVIGYKASYTYDRNNNVTGFMDYTTDIQGSLMPNSVIGYTIDDNNKTVYELDQAYEPSTGQIVNTDQYYFYYTINAPSAIQSVKNDLGAVLYPNPTTGNNININLTLGENTDLTLNTYDAQGRLLNSELRTVYGGANDLQISYPLLSSGLYYIQVISRNSEKISILKFVKN